MKCWIFQGNPDDYDLDEYFRTEPYVYWSVKYEKHRREVKVGDQVFFWRASGTKTKAVAGVVACGQVVEESVVIGSILRPGSLRDDLWHGSSSDPSRQVTGLILSDVRLTPAAGMLERRLAALHPTLSGLGVIKVGTGTNFRVEPNQATELVELWDAGGPPPTGLASVGSPEGRIKYELHKKRERDPTLVREKKKAYMAAVGFLECEICGWKGEDHYGTLGQDLVEVHHLKPVSEMKWGETTRLEDLMLVCPNCHRAVHKGDPSENLKILRSIFAP